MDLALDSYIKIYKGMIPEDVCKIAVESLSNAQWQTHSYRDTNGNYISYDKELSVSWDTIQGRDKIMDIFWQATNQYITHDLNMHWFTGWSGFTGVRFNKYDVRTQMREHCDHIHDIFDGSIKGIPTITVLAGLNNDYEGGDLVFFGNKKYKLEAGDIMVFPSSFLYPHRVDEVTNGTRYSCVSWVY